VNDSQQSLILYWSMIYEQWYNYDQCYMNNDTWYHILNKISDNDTDRHSKQDTDNEHDIHPVI